jgi:hypothetical protein
MEDQDDTLKTIIVIATAQVIEASKDDQRDH